MGRNLPKLALWIVPLLFVGVLFYWAMGRALGLGVGQNSFALLSDAYQQKVIWFTIGQAALSTLLAVLLGLPGAYLLYRKKFFGRNFARALITVPFILPTIVVAIALNPFRSLLSPILVILLAHLFLNYAIVVRTVGGAWSSLDREVEAAAALDGAGGWQLFWRITLPMHRPAIASASALVFLFCVTSFGIILVLGAGQINSVETEIYFSLTQFLDFKTAAMLSLVQTGITVVVFVISKSFGSSVAAIEQVEVAESNERIRRGDWLAVLTTSIFVITVFVIPLFNLFRQFTLAGFLNLSGLGDRDVLNISVLQASGNSLRNIVIAAGLAMLVGTLVSWLLVRSRFGLLEILFLLPLGVSPVVLGFGYLIAFPLRASWLVIPVVQALLATPMVIRLVHPALLSLGHEYREAAANAGANSWQIWRLVEAPMIGVVLRTAAVFAALVSLGEFGAASLLSYGDQATLPVVLYQLISRPGVMNYQMAMAASALLVLAVFAITTITSLARTPRR